MSLGQLVQYMKDKSFVREYENSVAFYFGYLEGSDSLLELLKGKKWSLETDGDFVILWVLMELRDEIQKELKQEERGE
jgi:hypothetical protein